MTESTDVATTGGDGLPALFDNDDILNTGSIKLPGVYLCHDLSDAVKNGPAEAGDVIVKTTPEDPDPEFLIDKDTDYFDGFVIHIDVSYARFEDGGMEWMDKSEYELARRNKEYGVWPVYRYSTYIPEFSEVLPASIMLTRMAGKGASQQINSLAAAAHVQGNHKPLAIRFGVRDKTSKNGKHSYKAWTATQIPADDVDSDDLAASEGMRQFVRSSSYEEPAIDTDAPTI